MARRTWPVMVLALVVAGAWRVAAQQPPGASTLGVFSGSGDIGTPSTIGPGSSSFDAASGAYTVVGGGANIWATADHFQYVWTKMSGDVTLTADIAFGSGEPSSSAPEAHRKACLMIRQSLDSDAIYADAAAHGEGLTSLQWREAKGGVTHEIQSSETGLRRLRVEKRGSYVTMSLADPGGEWRPAGGAARLELTGDFYVGLAVSAHNPGRRETVRFSNVAITRPAPLVTGMTTLVNTLETISLRSKDRRVAYVLTQPGRFEAPNWFPDATNTLYFNNGGRFFRIQADPPGATPNPTRLTTPEPVDLGMLTRINNDHGVTRDGKTWAFSDQSQMVGTQRPSLVYTMPVGGGSVTRITELGPSYFHGWSPDGKTLVYCAERNGNFDVYAKSADSGEERRLTTADGKDDGPEYSPDGQYIYFNSERTGVMQVWRMHPDGSGQEQLTSDDAENWFPHVSPDGHTLVFLTYQKGVGDHPENKDVMLRTMNLTTRQVDVLTKLFGGQGTINVDSWSPNSQYLAFVSYQIVPR